MKKQISKVVSLLLCAAMIVGFVPMNAFAANDYTINSTTSTDDYYNLISKKDWDIAPGITESEIVLNNDDGTRRQSLLVMEADLNNEYVKVINSYNGMIPQYGAYKTGVMSEQAAYAEANGYGNVVGAMNTTLSWYTGYPNDRVYEPLGFIMLDAEVLFDPANCGYDYGKVGFPSVLVINKDFDENGNPRPADIPKVEMPQITSAADLDGWEDQVIPCSSGYIVKDGVNQSKPSHGDGAPRSVVGIKPDGTVVIMLNDGRQAPYSTGMTMYELAEVMLDLGCSYAVNCDGGGSSTYLSQRPGEELKVNNSPSDGAERETTTGILFISTAPATGEFVRANISSEHDYYTPNSVVEFNAMGSDLVGTEAAIPAEAVWKLADDSFGTIENGVFTSNGKEGTVTVQLVYNDEVVGEDTINIVLPDTIAFAQSNMVVPYGKTVELVIDATYDSKPVCIKPADVTFELSNEALGTIDGFNFISAEEGTVVEPGTLTATIGGLTITANVSLGKGSEVVYDFEDANIEGWTITTNYPQYGPKGPNGNVKDSNGQYWYNGQNELGYLNVVDATTGKVRNGQYALAMECDFTQIYETGFHSLNMKFPKIDCADAVSVGFWMYVPFDARFSDLTINSVLGEKFFADGSAMDLCEGWHYMKLNAPTTDGFYDISISVDERASATDANGKSYYDNVNTPNLNGKFTFYIDDITVDYSTAVEDRENPVFSDPMVLNSTGETNAVMNGQTIKFNNPTFEVKVSDYSADNATGLNVSSAKTYVDGKEVNCTYANGKISVNGVILADGIHSVKFEISDNNGNSSWISGDINVQAKTKASTVKVVPQNPEADRLLVGSLYWMDVVASDIETIDKVEMTFDLNNASYWELEGMTTASGFDAEWFVQEDDNIATITIERTGDNIATGENVIASIPVRTWESHITEYEGYEDQTPATLVKRGIIWAQSIEIALEKGVIAYVDSYQEATSGTFGMDDILVDTELFFTNYTRKQVEGAQAWIDACKAAGVGFHEHTVTTLEDKAATCTEAGYTGRTYCEVCKSVVDWGTKEDSTGHNWQFDGNGVLRCVNNSEELYNGEYEGKTYVDGVVVADGWFEVDGVKTYYYKDGVKVTGSHIIDDVMCTFDEKGTYLSDYKYDGWYEVNDTVMYFISNKYLTGYQTIAGEFYLFDEKGMGYEGDYPFCDTTVKFENAQPVADEDVLFAGMCGDDIQFVIHQDGRMIVEGSGAMYDYSNVSYNPWYADYRYDVKTLTIGKDITSIGDRAFYNLWYLEKVTFEEGSKLKNIKLVGLALNNKMKEIELPYGVQSIGDASFRECNKLEKIVIPSSVTSIVSNSFYKTSNVTLYVVEGSYAHSYADKYGLNYVTYEEEERNLAFGTCGESAEWSLSSKGVLTISGSGAMYDYETKTAPWQEYKSIIKKVIVGKDITYVGKFSFMQCSKLAEVIFEAGGKLTTIGWGAFGYCSSLKEIIIPASVTTIDAYAFYHCTTLEIVDFAAGSELRNIGMYAFWQDTAVKNFFVPDKVVSIGENTFLGCKETATFNVAEGTYSHDYFKNNHIEVREPVAYDIASGTCGEGIEWVLESTGTLTISGSGKMNDYETKTAPWQDYKRMIKKVAIGKDITYVGKFSFMQCSNLEIVDFEVGSKLTAIGWGAFGYCSSLKEITIPASVETIEAYAFYYSTTLKTVDFAAGSELRNIGMYAFWQDTAVKNFFVPDKVVSIGENAFLGCKETATFNVAEGTYSHDYFKNSHIEVREPVAYDIASGTCGEGIEWVLESTGTLTISGSGKMNDYETKTAPWQDYKRMIKKVAIGKDITYVGKFSFMQCSNLETVDFAAGSKLTGIGWGAFGYCSSLKEITIPASVEMIEAYAFYYCTTLEIVDFEGESALNNIGMYAFWQDNMLKSINCPDDVILGEGTFLGTNIK